VTGFERPRYFPGKLVTVQDFELEQRYHIEKRWLLNRSLHGAGVVTGLEVTAATPGNVSVAPGFALDPRGRELLVCEPEEIAVPHHVEPLSICLLYAEVETVQGTIRETYELIASPPPVPEDAVVLGVIDADI
jgi:hypothetical protein